MTILIAGLWAELLGCHCAVAVAGLYLACEILWNHAHVVALLTHIMEVPCLAQVSRQTVDGFLQRYRPVLMKSFFDNMLKRGVRVGALSIEEGVIPCRLLV